MFRPLIRSTLRPTRLLRVAPITRRNLFFRAPFELYNNKPTITQRIFNLVPVPIKVLGLFTGSAAVLFFVATPLILIAGPPIALGVWWYGRKLRKMQADLYNQRWSNMGSYHLAFNKDLSSHGRMPPNARDRIVRALESNEQNLASQLGYHSYDMSQVQFTALETVHQDFKGSSQGFKEELDVSTYGLLDSTKQYRLANVVLVTHRELDSTNAKLRIELTTTGYNPRRFILESDPNDDDYVIEVKGR